MKLIVFSDSHRELSNMRQVIAREKPDYVFHLGDHDADAEEVELENPLLPLVAVRGNCDGWSDTPVTRTVTLDGIRFFLCHGHTLGVKGNLLRASLAAREQKADVLLFGHTHQPCREKQPFGLRLLNPGSCGYDRPTYGYFIIEHGKITDWGIRRCDDPIQPTG